MAYQQPPAPPWAAPPPPAPSDPPAPAPPRYDYASWPYRVASYLIDLFVTSVPQLVAFGIAAQLDPTDPAGPLIRLLGRVLSLVLTFCNIWMQGRTGQSVGKLLVGTRLVFEGTGLPVGLLTAFLRAVAHLADALPCFVGYLWPIWDARRQTFADKVAGTVVIKA